MQSNSDFEEILLAFNAAGVEYLVIGAFALAAYTRPRATGDIDLWVDTNPDNATASRSVRLGRIARHR